MSKKKDFHSYIDSVVYYENKFENEIQIKGWAYAEDGRSVELIAQINNEETSIKSYLMDRLDVLNHFGLTNKLEKIGFIVTVN